MMRRYKDDYMNVIMTTPEQEIYVPNDGTPGDMRIIGRNTRQEALGEIVGGESRFSVQEILALSFPYLVLSLGAFVAIYVIVKEINRR